MDRTQLVVLGIRAVASIGVNTVVGNMVNATTPFNANLSNRIAVGIGKFVISSMACDLADKYVMGVIQSVLPKAKE